ncbi:uncharacterized protein KNAG_0J01780 [Huiozyma naganishii CBS 8797]|uniref:Flo11 domain-containing protein n=1 Tax=Huiozyma naganishii (strain ATCC MYA-139 / BCRC 22969 / CBS 8797 / KCTC 17520 / NBRC 10181 / NCYC 3082 / Yp74L-3) TaxID=1071383 RepID=J7S9R6_HUIN7|nr:hypothetical protein KNAG_0J01780 [Kazachstania naganishii CBS 8797]CCK72259.1 hypothetical protein KNAG_0J01780 [Kazachstania naganishii CBS 8797]
MLLTKSLAILSTFTLCIGVTHHNETGYHSAGTATPSTILSAHNATDAETHTLTTTEESTVYNTVWYTSLQSPIVSVHTSESTTTHKDTSTTYTSTITRLLTVTQTMKRQNVATFEDTQGPVKIETATQCPGATETQYVTVTGEVTYVTTTKQPGTHYVTVTAGVAQEGNKWANGTVATAR